MNSWLFISGLLILLSAGCFGEEEIREAVCSNDRNCAAGYKCVGDEGNKRCVNINETATSDSWELLCPQESGKPVNLQPCALPFNIQCEGNELVTMCTGDLGGVRHCNCMGGRWVCPNIFCPTYCPKTIDEAEAGPTCTATEPGACYYNLEPTSGKPGTAVCNCTEAKLTCSTMK